MIYLQNYVFLIVKGMNAKVFNLMSKASEKTYTGWHKTCRCKCRLDASVCNNKQRWNKINADVNAKNSLKKVYVIKDLFEILIIVIVNVINHVMLGNIYITKIVNAETN